LQSSTRAATVALLVASSLALTACVQSTPNVPEAWTLCLSTSSSDFAALSYPLSGLPVVDDDLSSELPPNPENPGGDFDTGYQRVFYVRDALYVEGTSVVLPRGFPLWNAVRVYASVQKAREAFADMDPPRFVYMTPAGRSGVEMEMPSVGDESGAWYYALQVVDEGNTTSTLEVDAQIRFRAGNAISDIGLATWYAIPDETATLLLDVARVSSQKITDRIYAR